RTKSSASRVWRCSTRARTSTAASRRTGGSRPRTDRPPGFGRAATRASEESMQTIRHLRGVTLIELRPVIVVVAILRTIAVSSYRSYLLRTNRTEARMALLRVQAAQEKFFLQNNRYAG